MSGFGLKPKDRFLNQNCGAAWGRLSLRCLTSALRWRFIFNGQISFLIAFITHISSWWSGRPRRSLHRGGEPVRWIIHPSLSKTSHTKRLICSHSSISHGYFTWNDKITEYFSRNPDCFGKKLGSSHRTHINTHAFTRAFISLTLRDSCKSSLPQHFCFAFGCKKNQHLVRFSELKSVKSNKDSCEVCMDAVGIIHRLDRG